MKNIKLRKFAYSPGYCDMRGASHSACLMKNEDGKWIITASDREHFGEPRVITTYAVTDEAAAEFEAFILDNNVPSLARRLKSKTFATDYSPWSYSIYLDTGSGGSKDYDITQYRIYSPRDKKLLDELTRRFEALKTDKISETAAEKEEWE